ncbi:MAG: ParA family protein [Lachnospiraceae bacterium]|nr:ParA family protein [Lachnospiraceae bacterium]
MGKKTTKTIAFANNKGGSGKTTTCANVGYSLSALGKKVLMIDGDMQLNLSLSFFSEDEVLEFAQGEKNLYQAMKDEKDLTDYIVSTPYENLDLIPSSTLMSSIEFDLFTKWQREMILSRSLAKIKESGVYDYILIDAPPTLGGWVMNILVAADDVILPVEASPWGLFGVANMFEFLENVKKLSPNLSLMGVVVTKMDVRKNYGKQTMEVLRQFEEVNVFDTVIRVDSEIEWAQDNSKPVMVHKKSARSAGEYMELAKEVDKNARRSR